MQKLPPALLPVEERALTYDARLELRTSERPEGMKTMYAKSRPIWDGTSDPDFLGSTRKFLTTSYIGMRMSGAANASSIRNEWVIDRFPSPRGPHDEAYRFYSY